MSVMILLPKVMKSTDFLYTYSLVDHIRGSKGTILKMPLEELSSRVPRGKESEFREFLGKHLSMVFAEGVPIVISSDDIYDTRQIDVLNDALYALKIPDYISIAQEPSDHYDQYELEQEQEPEKTMIMTKLERRADYSAKLRDIDLLRKFLRSRKVEKEFIKAGIPDIFVHPYDYDVANNGIIWFIPTGQNVGRSFISVLDHAKRYHLQMKEMEDMYEPDYDQYDPYDEWEDDNWEDDNW